MQLGLVEHSSAVHASAVQHFQPPQSHHPPEAQYLRTNANKVKVLILIPSTYRMASVLKITTGTVMVSESALHANFAKDKHDHNHQKHCFKQCFDHFLNRLLHKKGVLSVDKQFDSLQAV